MEYSKMTLAEQRTLSIDQLPTDVIRTWNEWRDNFDESTIEKKQANSARLRAHFAACKAAGINAAAVAYIMKLGQK